MSALGCCGRSDPAEGRTGQGPTGAASRCMSAPCGCSWETRQRGASVRHPQVGVGEGTPGRRRRRHDAELWPAPAGGSVAEKICRPTRHRAQARREDEIRQAASASPRVSPPRWAAWEAGCPHEPSRALMRPRVPNAGAVTTPLRAATDSLRRRGRGEKPETSVRGVMVGWDRGVGWRSGAGADRGTPVTAPGRLPCTRPGETPATTSRAGRESRVSRLPRSSATWRHGRCRTPRGR